MKAAASSLSPSSIFRCPDGVPGLFAFTVVIPRGVEATSRVGRFADDIVQDLVRNGAEELVSGDLSGVEVHSCEVGVVVQRTLTVSCTTRYKWVGGSSPIDAEGCGHRVELRLSRMLERLSIAKAGANLLLCKQGGTPVLREFHLRSNLSRLSRGRRRSLLRNPPGDHLLDPHRLPPEERALA
jgi:hypothetical protein